MGNQRFTVSVQAASSIGKETWEWKTIFYLSLPKRQNQANKQASKLTGQHQPLIKWNKGWQIDWSLDWVDKMRGRQSSCAQKSYYSNVRPGKVGRHACSNSNKCWLDNVLHLLLWFIVMNNPAELIYLLAAQ